jgi:hypothetical protein
MKIFSALTSAIVVASISCCLQSTASEPAYKTEQWPAARELIWAHPGTSGELSDAKNWLTPSGDAVNLPPDRDTDIVLPAAATNYDIKGSRINQVRHVKIGDQARLVGGHRNELEIWGNLEVQPGGRVLYISIRGTKHTFVHLIGAEFPTPENGQALRHPSTRVAAGQQNASQISHKFQVAKVGTASVEFLGNVGISDEIMLQRGRMIVSGDLRFSGVTGKGALEIYDGGILEIQSGGRVAPFESRNSKAVFNVNIYRNGTIQAGSPERPLTSDAYLLLGFADNDQPGRTGLYAALGSMLRVYTTDPNKARLVVTSLTSVPGFCNGLGQPVSQPEVKADGRTGIAMQLAGDIEFDNTLFDYVSAGGIGLADLASAQQWENVKFGPNCAAPPEQLFSSLQADPNAYYHERGDQKSEFALTVTAMESMDQYLADADPFMLRALPENTFIKSVGKGGNVIHTPVAVVFNEPVEVTLTSKVPGARIRYTLDGTEPTQYSPLYEQPVRLEKTSRIMAKAFKPGVGFSPTFTTTYVLKP